jgi:hypothetical protein
VLSRLPSPQELEILQASLAHHVRRFTAQPDEAEILVAAGEYPVVASADAVQLAALTTIASTILNLDEAVTKQ